jgi:hypothetical protein
MPCIPVTPDRFRKALNRAHPDHETRHDAAALVLSILPFELVLTIVSLC